MKRIIVLSLCILAYTSFMAQNEFSKELFPTLAGLSRTYTIEYYDMTPNDGKRNGGYPELTAPTKDTIIDGKTYLQFDEYYSSLFSRFTTSFVSSELNNLSVELFNAGNIVGVKLNIGL